MFFIGTTKKLKSNKGSSLVMVLLISFLLTTVSIAFLQLTMSNLKMSILSSDVKKAGLIAESGVEKIAAVLDDIVFNIQESSKEETMLQIYSILDNDYALEKNFLTLDGEIDYSKINNEFIRLYGERFSSEIESVFSDINGKRGILFGLEESETSLIVAKDEGNGEAVLVFAELFDSSPNTKLNVLVIGKYKSYTSKTHKVIFELLPEPVENHYSPVPKIKIKEIVLPEILKKAILVEKDLIVADGNLDVIGDVLAFGTIPKNPLDSSKEDLNAKWSSYGGIVAGVPYAEDIDYSVYTPAIISKTATAKTGHINIIGSGATMSYIHSMYGQDVGKYSTITITSDAFARSIRSEQNAFFSRMNFGNDVYVMDNLQIDSANTEVSVDGKYFGFVTAGYDIDGTINPETYETYEYKHSSSIVINGNSELYLNGTNTGGVYIGGTAFLETHRNTVTGNPYLLGLSASPSSWNLIEAFEKVAGFLRYGYGDESVGVPASDADFHEYMNNPVRSYLLDEKNGALLSKKDRGFHIKGYWQNKWGADPFYPLDTGRIIIKTEDSDSNKIYGFLNGALVANSGVYHPFEAYKNNSESHISDAEFKDIQRAAKIKYYNRIYTLLDETYDQKDPLFDPMNIKLDYADNTKSLSDYTDTVMGNINMIVDGRIIYFKDSNIEIDYDSSKGYWTIDGQDEPLPDSGIIYATGDIFIRNGFNFKGTILAEGSLVCFGESTAPTVISHDEHTIKQLLYDSFEARLLFKLYRYGSIDDEPIETQRVLTRNILIKEWKVE